MNVSSVKVFQPLKISSAPRETFHIFIIAARMMHPPIGRTPVMPTPPLRRRGRLPLTPLPRLLLLPPLVPTCSLTIISSPEHLRVCVLLLPVLILCLLGRPLRPVRLLAARPRPLPFAPPLSSLISTPTPNPSPCTCTNRPPSPVLRMRPFLNRMAPPFTSNPPSFLLATTCSWVPPNPLIPPYLLPLRGQPVPVTRREEPS